MLPALLAQVGLPLLVKLVGGALGRVEHPAAQAAQAALDTVEAEIAAQTIDPAAVAEANRHIEALAAQEAATHRAVIAEVNATIRAEAAVGDPYTRRWRPTFGYVVALSWGALMLGLAWTVVTAPEHAGVVIQAMASLNAIWGVALAVLGVSVVQRSRDKARVLGDGDPADGLGRLVRAVRGDGAG